MSWSSLQNPDKQVILAALLAEQHNVCVYCGKRITTDFGSSHIEHFRPQSVHENRRFDWKNLFASCGPTGLRNMPRICGDYKENWDPVGHVEPTDPLCEKKFEYDGNGEIWPAAIGDDHAKIMIDKLNLGEQSLCYERFLIVAEIEDRINDGTIDATNQAAEIALWRRVDANGVAISYGHVAARYLEDQVL
ncbi:retron system putative HNH endonuclease [Allgaiera indica]|nr:retron system putative HNH endonuclease [Allgaiera indica]